jgi:CBS domain-containing protein
LWDSAVGNFAGVLTSSDMCDVLRTFNTPQSATTVLAGLTIAQWRAYAASAEGAARGLSSPLLYTAMTASPAALHTTAVSAVQPAGDARRGVHRKRARHRRSSQGATGSTAAAAAASAATDDVDMQPAPRTVVSAPVTAEGAAVFSDDEDDSEDDDEEGSAGRRAAATAAAAQGGGVHHRPTVSFSPQAAAGDRSRGDGPGLSAAAAAAAAVGRVVGEQRRSRPLACLLAVHPEDSLFVAATKMRDFGVHDIPVFDPEQHAVVAMLSARAIVSHVLKHFIDPRRLFDQPLDALRIGTFSRLIIVPARGSVVSTLAVMAEAGISSVPIVGPDNGVIDVFSRYPQSAVRPPNPNLSSAMTIGAVLCRRPFFAARRDDVFFLANDPSLMCLDAPIVDIRRRQTQVVRP